MASAVYPFGGFQALVQPLLGLPVSLPWKGIGPAIFLELGELAPLEPRQHHRRGEACIHMEEGWRVETGVVVLYGSGNDRPEIVDGIASLQGATLQSVEVVGVIPELVIQFSNGHRLRSMATTTGAPDWSIRLPNGDYVHARAGSLRVGDGMPESIG